MPRAKQPYCIDCGIIKTDDNSAKKKAHNGKLYYQSRCNACNTLRLVAYKHSHESLDKLYQLKDFHKKNYDRICKTIQWRLNK